ncbi:MAG TPA: ATP synthase F1 subunit delta [Armatimonadota bacterium]|jgi:F-type H+-transporting ATPase subunit delta
MADLRSASRYASALIMAAEKDGSLEAVQADLKSVVELLRSQPALQETLESPVYSEESKKRIWEGLLEGNVQPLTLHFVKLLVDKRRAGMEAAIYLAYTEMANAHRGVLQAEVTTAVPLPEDQQQRLREKLSRITGRTVTLDPHIDPGILGGVVVRLEDRLLDGSVRGQLQVLKTRLSGSRRA